MDLFDVVVAKKLSGGGGGSTVTIDGTANAPFGSLNIATLKQQIVSHEADVQIMLDTRQLVGTSITLDLSLEDISALITGMYAKLSIVSGVSLSTAVEAIWDDNGAVYKIARLANGEIQDVTAYASMVPSQVRIVYH